MQIGVAMAKYLDREAMSGLAGADAPNTDLRAIISAIAEASIDISDMLALCDLCPSEIPADEGGPRSRLEARAQRFFLDVLHDKGVRKVVFERGAQTVNLDAEGAYSVAIKPLDGASNINTNMTLGSIFSISFAGNTGTAHSGSSQLAAGFVVYGPKTTFVMTLGDGVDIFTLDRRARLYRLSAEQVKVPQTSTEYAIDSSNYQYWPAAVRSLIDDFRSETEHEPGAQTFNLRWMGSLVAEAYRVLVRGGVFLCPSDSRPQQEKGRLRLVFEAHPLAFVIEQAGGGATTGFERILDRSTTVLAERTPLIFGSREPVLRIERLHALPQGFSDASPLFGKRGLFRI